MGDLVKASNNRETFKKACRDFYINNEKRKHGKAAIADFTHTMGRIVKLKQEKGLENESNGELRDFKEIAINYLLFVVNKNDGELTKDKLQELPAMTLYSMVLAEAEKEADYVPVPEKQVDLEKEVDEQLEAERLEEERQIEEKRKADNLQAKEEEDKKEEEKEEEEKEKKESPEELQIIIDKINSNESIFLNEIVNLSVQKQQYEAKKFDYQIHKNRYDALLQDKKLIKKDKKKYDHAVERQKVYADALSKIGKNLLEIESLIAKDNESLKALAAQKSEKEQRKKEQEEQLRKEQEERLKKQQEEKLRREQEEKRRIEQDEQYRKEYEERQRAREERRKILLEEKKKALEEQRILELETRLINEYKDKLDREAGEEKRAENLKEEVKDKAQVKAKVKDYAPAEFALLQHQIMAEDLDRCMNIAKFESLDRQALRQERKWSDTAKKTLDLIGSLVSVEKLYDKKGKELTRSQRAKTILSDNAAVLTALLNERAGKAEGKKTLQEIGAELYGAEKKIISSITDSYLLKLLQKFEETAPKEKWTEADVLKILDGKDMGVFLEKSDSQLNTAVLNGDSIVDEMVTQAAKELFGSVEDGDIYLEIFKDSVEVGKTAVEMKIKDLVKELTEGITEFEDKNIIREGPDKLTEEIKKLPWLHSIMIRRLLKNYMTFLK